MVCKMGYCESCRHWFNSSADTSKIPIDGICRRFPPAQDVTLPKEQIKPGFAASAWVQPITLHLDSCGEWAATLKVRMLDPEPEAA